MLKFRLGSIPVEVRPSHLAVAALLAWSWMPGVQAGGMQAIPGVLVGAAVVFVSILVHELGHAVLARMFGYQPAIVIELFGGHTAPNAPGPIPWWKDILLTFAGPLFGFLLAGAALVALLMTGSGVTVADPNVVAPLWHQALNFFFLANIAWSVLNLLPVLPLDGGRISNALFTRVFGEKGAFASQGLSLIVCTAAIAWGLQNGAIILVVFFALFGFTALKTLSALMKGDAPPLGGAHPADLAFAQAAALFSQNRFSEAQVLAERTLSASEPLPKPSKDRLHHLLGWVAIKEGDGQTALDHFGRISSGDVEPQALAAALALAGDDARALDLWELAWKTTREPAVRIEWAGALIRLGRVDEARSIVGKDMPEAWRAAETTLLRRREYDAAAQLGLQALEEVPRPEVAYDTACSLAQAGRTNEAQRLLDRAHELGFRDASHAERDPDLAALRHTPHFESWLRRVQESASP